MSNLTEVDWSGIPAPEDDGAADHLQGRQLPELSLPGTDGQAVTLSKLAGIAVLYVYPMTGQPGTALPEGWDNIPGARGCTPQSCAFRDHHSELQALGVTHLYGVSTQTTADQQEAATRLELPYVLLSDTALLLQQSLELPVFQADGKDLLKRITIVARDGRIEKVFYPVFPPDRNASDVIEWLQQSTT